MTATATATATATEIVNLDPVYHVPSSVVKKEKTKTKSVNEDEAKVYVGHMFRSGHYIFFSPNVKSCTFYLKNVPTQIADFFEKKPPGKFIPATLSGSIEVHHGLHPHGEDSKCVMDVVRWGVDIHKHFDD